jgi:hypothetical protein
VHSWLTAASGTAGNAISFSTAMTLDASGNLCIGATSGTDRLNVEAPINLADFYGTTYAAELRIKAAATNVLTFAGGTSDALAFETGGSERARIDSNGTLLVGSTSSIGSLGERLGVKVDSGSRTPICTSVFENANRYHIEFYTPSGLAGYILTNTLTTTYATSSDYRLKNTITPMTGALAKVAQLKPVTYKWNADGSDGQGFIAHELAEVVPQCVTGDKDALDANGNPKYQGIDTSFLVATLTSAIQELKADFDAYKASHP